MAETGPISEMAEKISAEIFKVFNWERCGPYNQNWKCLDPAHETKYGTHPTDVVFSYQEPTGDEQIYFNVDLKSFGKGSINKGNLAIALTNLAKATSCAAYSEEWIKRHCRPDENRRVNGLLFIYNHDNEYKGDFKGILEKIEFDRVPLPKDQRLYTLSPEDIFLYYSVAHDIESTFKSGEHLFLYPDMLIFTKARSKWLRVASIEALLNPWLVVKGQKDNQCQINLYYRAPGETVDEFKFLIDFLFRCELVDNEPISVRLPNEASTAYSNFEEAKKQYAEDFYNLKEFKQRVDLIKFYPMTTMFKRYSSVNIGMEPR